MEAIISSSDPDTSFVVITERLRECEDKYLTDLMAPLNFLRHEAALDWIEKNAERTVGVSQLWGHLAASSNLSWNRATEWLRRGRPWSLIALDGLVFCTTRGKRLNQSAWMRQIDPRLPDRPECSEAELVLRQYLSRDNVPRTRKNIEVIINNLCDGN